MNDLHRLYMYLALWIVVFVTSLVEVILDYGGLGYRILIALTAWFGGLVTHELVAKIRAERARRLAR